MSIISNSGVTVSAVQSALSDGARSLGELCTSPNVQQWSFNKPVRSNKLTLQQPQDLYAVNDGFYVQTYYDPFDLLDEFFAGLSNCWEYQKPTGDAASPYRLGDFRGYNNAAGLWFNYQFDNQDRAYVGETRRLTNNSTNPAVDIDTILNNFPAFSAVSPSLHPQGASCIVLLMVAADSNGNRPLSFNGCELYNVCNVLDYDERLNFKVPSGITTGKYFFVPAIVSFYVGSAQSFEHLRRDDLPNYLQGATWYPLPTNNNITLTVSSSPYTPTLDFTTEITSMTVSFNYNNNDEISDLEGDIEFTFSSPQSYQNDAVAVTINYIRYTNSPTQPSMNLTNMTGTPQPPNYLTTGELHFNYKDSFVALKDNWKDDYEMPFVVKYTVYKNGISQTFTESYKATVTEINGHPYN